MTVIIMKYEKLIITYHVYGVVFLTMVWWFCAWWFSYGLCLIQYYGRRLFLQWAEYKLSVMIMIYEKGYK